MDFFVYHSTFHKASFKFFFLSAHIMFRGGGKIGDETKSPSHFLVAVSTPASN